MNTDLPSLRKAAILVASLDPPTADRLLDEMTAEQASLVRRLVRELDEVEDGEQANVIHEFFRGSRPAAVAPPRIERSEPWPPTDKSGPATPFRFLREAKAAKLAPLLAEEHPQTIAVVISHLSPDQASELLASLSAEAQVQVIERLMVLDEADPEIVREVERGLQSRVVDLIRDERRRAAGLAAVNNILEAAAPRARQQLLANIARHDRSLSGKIGAREVGFEELEWLTRAGLEELLAAVEPDVVHLALVGASTSLVERVLAMVPAREAKALRHELQRLGPTRLSDVEQAQRRIAAVAAQLGAEGRIELPRPRAALAA